MRVLVCGGRDYNDRATVDTALWKIHSSGGITCLIEGGAKGADALAWSWAHAKHIPIASFPADWDKHGRAAGPIRNQRMLDEGKPDLVLVFPGGRGTEDMARRAEAAGVMVRRV